MHALPHLIQFRLEAVPARVTQCERNGQTLLSARGQVVGLPVRILLQPVFHGAEIAIGVEQDLHGFRRHQLQFAQAVQYYLDPALLESALLSPAYQLEGLADELDFADTAGAELDVLLALLAHQFQGDLTFQLAQLAQRAIIEIAPVDEGPQEIFQLPSRREVARHRPRLDHGVALPLAGLALVIRLHRIETHHQRPGIAERAEARIHPEDKAVLGHGIQHRDQLARQFGVELGVGGLLAVVEFTVVAVGEDQVDVRGKIQLPGAQLAHAQHHQVLRLAPAVHRRAARLASLPEQDLQRGLGAGVRQPRHIQQRFRQGRPAGDVPPGDAHHLAVAEAPQHRHELAFGLQSCQTFGQ